MRVPDALMSAAPSYVFVVYLAASGGTTPSGSAAGQGDAQELPQQLCLCGVQGPETQHSGLDRAAALCHQDGILHMTCVDLADCILLTCGHDGVVKAWK